MQRVGIDHDSAEDGVFLPASGGSPNPLGSAVHAGVHTNAYFDAVNNALVDATSQDEVIGTLDEIRSQLVSGQFP